MARMSLFSGRRALLWLVPAFSIGCASVLGLPDREIDPTFGDESDAGDAGDATDAGDAGDAGGDSPECVAYCAEVLKSCAGVDAVYASPEVCLGVCAKLPPGAPGSTTGNNVACRAGQAHLAATTGEVKQYCPPAGPGGGSGVDGGAAQCGSNCDGYCSLMAAICPGEFATAQDCMDTCASVPDVGGYNISQMDGNFIQCRLYHLSAATQAPEVHCAHAAGAVHCM